MAVTQKEVEQQAYALEKFFNKIQLFYKKEERMGLTEEEKQEFDKMKIEYFIKCDELLDTTATYFIDSITMGKCDKYLKEIQKYVPWNGRLVLREHQHQAISEAEENLTYEELEIVGTNLAAMHVVVFDCFESYCETDEGYEYVIELAQAIVSREDADVYDLVDYIDARYREFGELLGIELEELEIEFYDDEE